MLIYFLIPLIAYLLGSIPFGYILVRVFKGEDVRAIGSGNIGATNVARKAPGLGVATLILDATKGFAAVAIASALAHSRLNNFHSDVMVYIDTFDVAPAFLAGIAALFAILGHMFPVWLKFKGGKGVATGVGSFLALAPKAVLIVLIIFVAVVALFRYISLGSIIATALFPLFVWITYRAPWWVTVWTVASAVLIIVRHHENIRRLLAGTEHRFELKHR